MEKKKVEKKAKKDNKNISDEELEALKKKIEEKFKKLNKNNAQDSELERELKIIDSFDSEDFTDLLMSRRFGAPVLNQIAVAPQIISPERTIRETPQRAEDSKEDQFKYNASSSQEDERKYLSNSASISANPMRVDFNELGRGPDKFLEDKNLFMQSPEAKMSESNGIEKYTLPSHLDRDNLGKKDPFKKEERKYDPKLPR